MTSQETTPKSDLQQLWEQINVSNITVVSAEDVRALRQRGYEIDKAIKEGRVVVLNGAAQATPDSNRPETEQPDFSGNE